MKKIIALLLGAVLFGSLVACAGSGGASSPATSGAGGGTMAPVTADKTLFPSAYTDADFDTSGDIVIKTEHDVYGADAPKVAYTVTNNTATEFTYGVAYSLEINMNGTWYQVPFPDNTSWIMIGIILKPNETNAAGFSFSQLNYHFQNGTYRLIKEIGGKHYFAEFRIGESPITAETPFAYQPLEMLPKEYTGEAAAANGDMVIGHDGTRNGEKLAAFVHKASLGMAAMVRIVQYTDEGDPIITDVIYDNDYYSFKLDNSRDSYGGTTVGLFSFIYSYLVTDGKALYLSNCADWELTRTYTDIPPVPIALGAKHSDVEGSIGVVQNMTEKRLAGNVTLYQAYSPGGDKAVSLVGDMGVDVNEKLSYGYAEPGRGDMRMISDPDKIATELTGVFWLDEETFVLICETTTSELKYFEIVGKSGTKSDYGTGYTYTDGQFVITNVKGEEAY